MNPMRSWLAAAVISSMLMMTVSVGQSTSVTIAGRGDQVTDVVSFQAGLLMVEAAHKGQRNFAVQLLSTNGQTSELLVNAIGNYQGVRLIPVSARQYRFQVQADQAWVLMHEQLDRNRPGTALPITHKHSGDAPLGPFTLRRRLLRAAFTHSGDRNFAVFAVSSGW